MDTCAETVPVRRCFDFHCHPADMAVCYGKDAVLSEIIDGNLFIAASCGSVEELRAVQEFRNAVPDRIKITLGVHPKTAVFSERFDDMVSAMETGAVDTVDGIDGIDAIGEIGVDFFSDPRRQTEKQQLHAFELQLKLAAAYRLPAVIHCCRGLDCILKFARLLADCPFAVFHGWQGTAAAARQILAKDIDARFSFGCNSRNYKKRNQRLIDCIQSLPPDRILLETDAPFQATDRDIGSWRHGLQDFAGWVAAVKGCTLEAFMAVQESVWNTLFMNGRT